MVEAVRTTASPAAIWAICVVAVCCLGFWLGAVAWADMHPRVRHRPTPDMLPEVPAQRGGEPEPGEAPAAGARPPVAGQPVPAQRSGEADRPAHTVTGAGPAERN